MLQRYLFALIAVAAALPLLPGTANAQFFGRNKVQYRTFDFRILRTEHFDIYYYDEEREAALDVARMAERAYARLSRLLQHEFRERKPLILYASHAHFQQTNAIPILIDESMGAFAEALRSRVVIPLTGSYAEFDHVLRHELVHSFQHDIIIRNAALDNVNPFSRGFPYWFMEGMAEYLSIGHIDAVTAAWLRDASLSGYLRTIEEMNRRDDYLSYRFGQALWAYIGSKWGDEVIGILLQRATRIGIERAFEITLGMSLAELSQEWTAAVRKTYLPQVTEYDLPTRFATPVLRHERVEDPLYLAPAISPDGDLIAVFSQREGFFPDLWLVDAKTGKFLHRVATSSREADFESLRYGSSSASFSPDGRYLAFAAQTGGRDALYIYDLERKRMFKKLEFDLAAIMAPSWAPDGRRIAFSGLDGGLSDLYITDLDGNFQRLTRDRHADLFPSWSPDGRAIAFSTDRTEETDFDRLAYGELRVALYHLDTGEIEVLPHQERGRNLNPVWAPDSRSLVWVSDRTGTKDLYLYDRDEAELYKITNLLSGVMGPTATDLSPVLSWARRSGRLLFVYFEAAGQSVYAIDDPRALPRVAVSELPEERVDAPVLALDVEPVEPTEPIEPAEPAGSARADAAAEKVASISVYRGEDGFRPSDQLPEGVRAPEPLSVIALLDSADYALPDTSDFVFLDYKVKFSPDMIGRPTIGAQVGGYYGNGLYGGSFIALSDILGNHNILLSGSVDGSFSDATFYAGYNFLKTRMNYGLALMQIPVYRYLGTGPVRIDRDGQLNDALADVFYRDLYRMLDGVISYPFSTYRRIEFGGTLSQIKRDQLFRGINVTRNEPLNERIRIEEHKYLQPMAALVFDNTYFGYTGPIIGRRYRLQVSRTLGDYTFTEGMLDFRNYLNYKRTVVLATQVFGLARFGSDGDRFGYYWGGPYFLRGYDGGSFSDRECSRALGDSGEQSLLACPAQDQLIGSSAALFRTELRFPVIKELQIGFLGNFPPVDAVFFFDGGLAWDNRFRYCTDVNPVSGICNAFEEQDVKLVWKRTPEQDPALFRQPLFSYGMGLRINVFFAILRLDYAFPLNRPDRSGRFSVSFGPSF